jgi:hypothetical protein
MIAGDLVLDGSVAKTNFRTFRRKHIGFVFQKSNLIPVLRRSKTLFCYWNWMAKHIGQQKKEPWNCSFTWVSLTVQIISPRCFLVASSNVFLSRGRLLIGPV